LIAVDPILLAVRWLHLTAVLTLFGTALWRVCAPKAVPEVRPMVFAGLAALACASSLTWLAVAAAGLAGWQSAGPDLLLRLAFLTLFGRALAIQAVLALILALQASRAQASPWPALVLSCALAVALAFVGHAAAGVGALGWVRLAAQVGHILGAGAWLGGLPALFLTLQRANTDVCARALRRFSGVGLAAVLLIGLTGAANTAFMFSLSEDVWRSLYLRVLLAKLGLVVVMLGIALVNRSLTDRLLPAPDATLAALRRNVAVESVIGLAVVALVSWLGSLDPSM
jgi:putative copper resistance protein D